jgi:hypothetical protein
MGPDVVSCAGLHVMSKPSWVKPNMRDLHLDWGNEPKPAPGPDQDRLRLLGLTRKKPGCNYRRF